METICLCDRSVSLCYLVFGHTRSRIMPGPKSLHHNLTFPFPNSLPLPCPLHPSTLPSTLFTSSPYTLPFPPPFSSLFPTPSFLSSLLSLPNRLPSPFSSLFQSLPIHKSFPTPSLPLIQLREGAYFWEVSDALTLEAPL